MMGRRGQALRVLVLVLLVYALPVTLLSQSSDASSPSSGTALPGSLSGAALSRVGSDVGSDVGSELSHPIPPGATSGSAPSAHPVELPAPEPLAPPVSPFTGSPTDLAAPVLVVKIDNASVARPQSGLERADLVYVEPVEGGLSRLLAVFQSQLPPVVGPVRSTRASDVELLANFGRPALAFSGAAPSVGALVASAPVLDASELARPGDYHRDRRRRMPHNLYGDPSRLREGGAPPRDIGFRFGPTPAGGNPVEDVGVSYPATRMGVRWDSSERRWLISMDGAPLTSATGPRPNAATVVLQRVSVRDAGVRDAAGSPSPFAATVGSGDVVVLRDGLAFAGSWSRPSPEAITTFTMTDGSPLSFAPGPVWVVLIPV